MLDHDYQDMPGQAVGEQVMVLRCHWCMKTPTKAREDGCPIHELQETGSIFLHQFNPDGVEYFKGRKCVTCGEEIMDHMLYKGSDAYWCSAEVESGGIEGCTVDVEGIKAPQELCPPQ